MAAYRLIPVLLVLGCAKNEPPAEQESAVAQTLAAVQTPVHFPNPNLVSEAYEMGRESVQLERERDEMLRVVKFIECLDREVGHTVRGPEVERHIKKNTKAARTCKAQAGNDD